MRIRIVIPDVNVPLLDILPYLTDANMDDILTAAIDDTVGWISGLLAGGEFEQPSALAEFLIGSFDGVLSKSTIRDIDAATRKIISNIFNEVTCIRNYDCCMFTYVRHTRSPNYDNIKIVLDVDKRHLRSHRHADEVSLRGGEVILDGAI